MTPYDFRAALGYRDPNLPSIGYRRNEPWIDTIQRTSIVAGTLDADSVVGTFQSGFQTAMGVRTDMQPDGRARTRVTGPPVLPRTAAWLLTHDVPTSTTPAVLSFTITVPLQRRTDRASSEAIEGFDRFVFGWVAATMQSIGRYLGGQLDVPTYANAERPLGPLYAHAAIVELRDFDIGPRSAAAWQRDCTAIVRLMRDSLLWRGR